MQCRVSRYRARQEVQEVQCSRVGCIWIQQLRCGTELIDCGWGAGSNAGSEWRGSVQCDKGKTSDKWKMNE